MKTRRLYRMFFGLCAALLASLVPLVAFAQCDAAHSLMKATAIQNNGAMVVLFDYSTNWSTKDAALVNNVQMPANWNVFSPTLLQKARTATDTAARTILYERATPSVKTATISGGRGIRLEMSSALDSAEKYMINLAENSGVIPVDCLGVALAVGGTEAPSPRTPPATNDTGVVLQPVEKRDDADIYIEGLAEGAESSKTAYTIDASIGKKFAYNHDDPEYYWQPFFDIKASTNPKADPNSLDFGVSFANPSKLFKKNPFQVKQLFFTESPKFEADRDFKNVDFVGDFQMRIVSRLLNYSRFNIVPFVGIEVGKNLQSPLIEAKGNGIARPYFGANLFAKIYEWKKENGYQPILSFETLYQRRFPLTGEVALDEDDDGNLLPLHISRTPRDYIKSSLSWNFAQNFGFKLNYEYGSLPPLFKFVNNKFSIGLVFKGIFKKK